MPRQDQNDPNRQQPSRRDASYGVYNQLGALQQSQAFQVGGQAGPGVQQGQVTYGTTTFGQGANILQTTPNTSQQLANLLSTALGAASDAAQTYKTVGTVHDNEQAEALQQRLGEAEEQYSGAELESKRAEIYKEYQDKMMLNRSKQDITARYYNAKSKVAPLKYEDMTLDFKLAQLKIENGEYDTEEERIQAMIALKEEWSGLFTEAFKNNELLLKRAEVLLQGYTGETNDSINTLVDGIIGETMGNLKDHLTPFIQNRLAGDPTLNQPGAGIPSDSGKLYAEFVEYLEAQGVALPAEDPELGPLLQERIEPELSKFATQLEKTYNRQRYSERQNGLTDALGNAVNVFSKNIQLAPVGSDPEDLDGSGVITLLDALSTEYDTPSVNRTIADQIHSLAYSFGVVAYEDVDTAYNNAANFFIEKLKISRERKEQIKSFLPKTRDWSRAGIDSTTGARSFVDIDSKTNELTLNVGSFKAVSDHLLSSSQLERRSLAPETDASLEALQQAYVTRVLSEMRLDQDPVWRTLSNPQQDQALLKLQQLVETAIDQTSNTSDALMFIEDGLAGIPEVALYPGLESVMFNRVMQLMSSDAVLSTSFDLRDMVNKDATDPDYTFDFSVFRDQSNILLEAVKGSPYSNYDEVNLTVNFTRPLSPEQIAIGAFPSQDKFGQVLANFGITRIPQTNSSVGYTDSTVAVLDAVLLQENPISIAFREGSEQHRKERFKEVLNRITGDQPLSANTVNNLYQGYLRNIDNFADPVVREEYKQYAHQQILEATAQSRVGTRMWQPLSKDQLDAEDKQWKAFGIKAQSGKGWQDAVYDTFERDVANSVLMYLDTQVQGSVGLADIKAFFTQNGFTWDGEFVTPTVNNPNDDSHMSNHQIIAFGFKKNPGAADGQNVAIVGDAVNGDLIPYFVELSESEGDTTRSQNVIQLLSLPWDAITDDMFVEDIRFNDLDTIQSKLRKYVPNDTTARELALLTHATFSPERGLTQNGLAFLDQYARGTVELDPNGKRMYNVELMPVLKNGMVYFAVNEQIVQGATGTVRQLQRVFDFPFIRQSNTSSLRPTLVNRFATDVIADYDTTIGGRPIRR